MGKLVAFDIVAGVIVLAWSAIAYAQHAPEAALIESPVVHAESATTPGDSLWWNVITGVIIFLSSILLAIFWRWVDGIHKVLPRKANAEDFDKLNAKVAEQSATLAVIHTRLTVQESHCVAVHEGADKSSGEIVAKMDALSADIKALSEGMHALRLQLVQTLSQHGVSFGKPSTNPGNT
jgi:site-specific recombinase